MRNSEVMVPAVGKKAVWLTVKRSLITIYNDVYDEHLFVFAAGLSYYFVLSLFPLLLSMAGNLYGTTEDCSIGTVFKLDTSGTYTVLHSFTGSDGAAPDAALIMDSAGNLYSTTGGGGAFGYGTVFKLDTSGNETVLHSFTDSGGDGGEPAAALIMDSAGSLYSTTSIGGSGTCFRSGPARGSGCGTVFKLDTFGNETVLHRFAGSDGATGSVEPDH